MLHDLFQEKMTANMGTIRDYEHNEHSFGALLKRIMLNILSMMYLSLATQELLNLI